MSQIPLFTSIPTKWNRPAIGRNFGPTWLRLCVDSWKASGFRPISLNSAVDIEGFSTVPIEFQPVARARPLITDFFDAAKKSGSRIAGIVNADCMMIPQLGLSAALENHLDNGIVVVERLNISQYDLRPTGQHCLGFDAFFFTIDSLEKIRWSEDWKIGSVWWDYCFSLAFHAASQKIRTLPSPGVIHLDHERRWSLEEWRSAMSKLISAVKDNVSLYERAKPHLPISSQRDEEYYPFIEVVYDWLRSREPLYTPAYESVEEFMTFMVSATAAQEPQLLSVKQLVRQIPAATVRAVKRRLRA